MKAPVYTFLSDRPVPLPDIASTALSAGLVLRGIYTSYTRKEKYAKERVALRHSGRLEKWTFCQGTGGLLLCIRAPANTNTSVCFGTQCFSEDYYNRSFIFCLQFQRVFQKSISNNRPDAQGCANAAERRDAQEAAFYPCQKISFFQTTFIKSG